MESTNRNIWIIVVAVLGLAVMCCCLLMLAALLLGGLSAGGFDWSGATSLYQERTEYWFTVGDVPTLEIDNSTGPVTVRAGEGDEIHIVATKRARLSGDVDRNEVDLVPAEDGLMVKAWQVPGVHGASVSLEITAPPDTRVQVHNGTGPIDVSGFRSGATLSNGTGDLTIVNVGGAIDAHAGTGTISVRGAAGPVSLDTGTGSLNYDGAPEGPCRFETGTGSITLALPADLDARVDLSAGTGSVKSEFDVDGNVTKRSVRGTIGSGEGTTIRAGTGTGNIQVSRR